MKRGETIQRKGIIQKKKHVVISVVESYF